VRQCSKFLSSDGCSRFVHWSPTSSLPTPTVSCCPAGDDQTLAARILISVPRISSEGSICISFLVQHKMVAFGCVICPSHDGDFRKLRRLVRVALQLAQSPVSHRRGPGPVPAQIM
jgi:hypothetical protein